MPTKLLLFDIRTVLRRKTHRAEEAGWFGGLLRLVADSALSLAPRVLWATSAPAAFPLYRGDGVYSGIVLWMFATLVEWGIEVYDPAPHLCSARIHLRIKIGGCIWCKAGLALAKASIKKTLFSPTAMGRKAPIPA